MAAHKNTEFTNLPTVRQVSKLSILKPLIY